MALLTLVEGWAISNSQAGGLDLCYDFLMEEFGPGQL